MRKLPEPCRTATLDFSGSIAQLSQLARHLITLKPTARFVIVRDEFDEIHPEMYRYGPLAEAFFSNLRTLSAKPNIEPAFADEINLPPCHPSAETRP